MNPNPHFLPALIANNALNWSSPSVLSPAVLYDKLVIGDRVDVKWNLDGCTINLSYGARKINSEGSVLSMKIRFWRGEPKFPNELYSPRKPVLKKVFINSSDTVSGCAAVLSPKRSSIVHTFNPRGISLCWLCIESDTPRLLLP